MTAPAARAIAAFKAAGVNPVPPVTGNDATIAALQLIIAGRPVQHHLQAERDRCRGGGQRRRAIAGRPGAQGGDDAVTTRRRSSSCRPWSRPDNLKAEIIDKKIQWYSRSRQPRYSAAAAMRKAARSSALSSTVRVLQVRHPEAARAWLRPSKDDGFPAAIPRPLILRRAAPRCKRAARHPPGWPDCRQRQEHPRIAATDIADPSNRPNSSSACGASPRISVRVSALTDGRPRHPSGRGRGPGRRQRRRQVDADQDPGRRASSRAPARSPSRAGR